MKLPLKPNGKPDTDSYGTPRWLYDHLNREFNFVADLFASDDNALHKRYFTKERPWGPIGWQPPAGKYSFMNPPYSTPAIGEAMDLARMFHMTYKHGIVALVRADASTRWWHSYVDRDGVEVRDVPFRLRFEGGGGAYNFPSAIVVMQPYSVTPPVRFVWRELERVRQT